MGLRGLYQEAVAKDSDGLEEILSEYEDVLSEHPMNVVRTTPVLTAAVLLTITGNREEACCTPTGHATSSRCHRSTCRIFRVQPNRRRGLV